MNKKSIEQRLAELVAMEQQVTQNIQKAQADLSAINGAKQDCQFWLAKLSAELSATVEPVKCDDFGIRTMQPTTSTKRGRKKKVS